MMRGVPGVGLLLLCLATACSSEGAPPVQACESVNLCVDCRTTCQRMLQCQVSFADPNAGLPGLAASDDETQCERGCATTDTITPTRERCIKSTNPAVPEQCHKDILACLGVDAGPAR